MGLLADYRCDSCAFHAENLYLPPAPHPDEFDPRLVSCAACAELRSVHRPTVARGCATCGGPLTVHRDEDAVPCPRCGRMLVLIPGAIAD